MEGESGKIPPSLSYPGEKLLGTWVRGRRGNLGNLEHKSPRKSTRGSLQPALSLAGGQKLLLPPEQRIGHICLEENNANTGLLSQATRAMAG